MLIPPLHHSISTVNRNRKEISQLQQITNINRAREIKKREKISRKALLDFHNSTRASGLSGSLLRVKKKVREKISL